MDRGGFSLRSSLDGFGKGLVGSSAVVAARIRRQLLDLGLEDPAVFLEFTAGLDTEALFELFVPDADLDEKIAKELKTLVTSAARMQGVAARASCGVSPALRDTVSFLKRKGAGDSAGNGRREEEDLNVNDWTPHGARRKYRRKLLTETPGSQAEKDRNETVKWVSRFRTLVEGLSFPAIAAAKLTANPEMALDSLVGASRAGTLRKRVRTWETFSRWLAMTRGRVWPAGVQDIVDYLHMQTEENPRTSFPKSFAASLRWMESRVGIEPAARLSQHDLFKRCIEKEQTNVEQGAEVGRSPRFPVAVLMGLEMAVSDPGLPVAVRVGCWVRLLKVVASLRSDDLQRVRPDTVTLLDSGLSAKLLRTKTSGAGKKVRELVMYVPRCAWLVNETWLETGFALWETHAGTDRDFFLPRPTLALDGFSRKLAGPGDLAALGRECLRRVGRPRLLDGVWVPGAPGWLPAGFCRAFTGHSERATLVSILAAMGTSKSDRDPLGRWSPEGSDAYVRNYRALVRRLVLSFQTTAWKEGAHECFDEDHTMLDACGAARSKLGDGAVTDWEVEDFTKEAKEVLKDLAGWQVKGQTVDENVQVQESTNEVLPDPVKDTEGDKVTEVAPYLVSVSKRGTVSRLHKAQGCWRARGLRFSDFEMILDDPPRPSQFTTFCRDCWPGAGPTWEKASASSSSSAASSSSASA